ncbi:hypothetical protein Ga0100231_006950 [Opitutaceae bacterium TAV4]|nr:hypothetical protein Ga0100231_006950 [Opitutaceae bacterium TAV4]
MNILIFRDISATDLTALSAEFPQCNFRQTMDLSLLEKDPSWPAVIFGNVPSALLPRCSNLRWLQIVSSGFDEYLPPPASHVIMTTARDIRAPIIAEQVVMTFLAFARQLPHFLHCQREKKWDRRPSIPQIIQKQTVGILGYGSVGKEVARLLKPFGVRLIATKRSVPPPPPPPPPPSWMRSCPCRSWMNFSPRAITWSLRCRSRIRHGAFWTKTGSPCSSVELSFTTSRGADCSTKTR